MNPGAEVLEIGASKVGVRHLRTPRFIGEARHTVVDLVEKEIHRHSQAPHRFLRQNAEALTLPSASFDFVTCNHALGFIPDFRRALREIRRVLKPTGEAMLNTPLRSGPTLSAAELRRREPRNDDAYYAENGTAWHFGQDYFDEIRAAGFTLRELRPFANLAADELHRRGLKADEPLFLARPV